MFYMVGLELLLPLRAGLPAPDIYAQEVVNVLLKGLQPEKEYPK